MSDLRTRLDRLAERGEPRGAAVVYRRAKEQMDAAPGAPVPISAARSETNGRGRWRVLAVALAVFAVVGVAVAVFIEMHRDAKRVIVAQPVTSKRALATEPSATLFWLNGAAVMEGDARTGKQVRLTATRNACQSCAGVRFGRYVFLSQPRILRVDTADGTVKDLGPGLFVFRHPDGRSLYAVLFSNSTASSATTIIEHVDVDGHVLGGPWTLPAGQVLPSPPRAVVGGVLTQTNENAPDHTLSVWNPTTGHLSVVGPFRDLIDTRTTAGATSSVVAFSDAGCPTVGCGLTITRFPDGSPRRIAAPAGAPGFIGGGAFSPDGDQLAVFVDRVPEAYNPGGRLVIVTVGTGAATPIAASTISFGEPFGFATWSPDGKWVYFGGGSPRLKAHYRDTPDAVGLLLPAWYSVVAGPSHSPAPAATADPGRMCATALGSTKTVLNAMAASVQDVRELVVGPGRAVAPHAFATARGTDRAAWCWTGRPTNYTLFAVGPDGSAVRIEGLGGPTFISTPPPGPAPIP
jgi:hypothetical protein